MGPYCKFCQMRCFVPMPKGTPDYILKAYGSSTIVATCKHGQAFEKKKTGYCYNDIKDAIAALEQARAECPFFEHFEGYEESHMGAMGSEII